jgi:hypothetical protein
MNRNGTPNRTLSWKAFRIACLALLCGLAVSSGCSPKDKAGVTGSVTLNGKPAENIQVVFVPDRGPGAAGHTGADGGYVLNSGPRDKQWVVTGRCGVFFVDLSDPPVRLPNRYGSAKTSGFTVELKPGPNVCDFALESK